MAWVRWFFCLKGWLAVGNSFSSILWSITTLFVSSLNLSRSHEDRFVCNLSRQPMLCWRWFVDCRSWILTILSGWVHALYQVHEQFHFAFHAFAMICYIWLCFLFSSELNYRLQHQWWPINWLRSWIYTLSVSNNSTWLKYCLRLFDHWLLAFI